MRFWLPIRQTSGTTSASSCFAQILLGLARVATELGPTRVKRRCPLALTGPNSILLCVYVWFHHPERLSGQSDFRPFPSGSNLNAMDSTPLVASDSPVNSALRRARFGQSARNVAAFVLRASPRGRRGHPPGLWQGCPIPDN